MWWIILTIALVLIIVLLSILLHHESNSTRITYQYNFKEFYYQVDKKKRRINSITLTLSGNNFLEFSKIEAITHDICYPYFFKILVTNSHLLEQTAAYCKYLEIENKPTCELLARNFFDKLKGKYSSLRLEKISLNCDGYSVEYGKSY